MPSPLISVIIPAYNNGEYLLEAIQSVLAQDYANVELIVVDDGSTDDTAQLLDACADSLTWQYQENAGIAGARNAGYRLARGSFIAFLDADDVYTAGRLSLQMSAFDDEPALECVQGHMQQFVSPELPEDFAQGIRGQTGAVIPAPLASTTLIRRAAYDRVGPWDQTLNVGVDMDWYARMRETGLHYRMLEQVLLRRRIHRTNTNLRCANEQSERLYILKNMLDRRRALQASDGRTQGETGQ
jgi:glycosyltransferase involved in cell wall biosynthesis